MRAGTGGKETIKGRYLVPAVGVSSTAEWKKDSKIQLKRVLAFKKVMRTFTNIKRILWFRVVYVKRALKKVRHKDDEMYLVVMMSALYPADIDIILDDI